MLNFIRKLIKPKYETLNRIEINAQALIANFNYLKSQQPKAELFPVLKSNAYGHGLKEIAHILNRTSAKMVVVDSFPEAQIVYKSFRGKVLILGEMPLGAYSYCNFRRTEFVVYNASTIKYLATKYPGLKVHLFLNTGMNREGIKDLIPFWEENKKYLKRLSINGLCSHLAAANQDVDFNNKQEKIFLSNVEYLKQQGIRPRYIHLGNSAAIFRPQTDQLNAFRPGLALYGYNPLTPSHPGYLQGESLLPILSIYSKIVAVQNLGAGQYVSYGLHYQAEHDTRVAVIPFGYHEGLDRRLSVNKASEESGAVVFEIRNASGVYPAKIAGKVCMNLSCLDLNQNTMIKVGDEVELVSPDKRKENSLIRLAQRLEIIPYEFLVKLDKSIRRVVV